MAASFSVCRLQLKQLFALKSLQLVCRASYCTSKPPTKPKSTSIGKPSGESQTTTGSKYESGQYYKHNEFTYYDIEDKMAKSRVGQPASPRAGEHC
ncbi:uncharacterized protein [Antedon mediterranea]|uniref:uncharacterized protein n=1 Tax=Antedon mediterranea TaxID=105859 RepID=UPI003AF85225